VAAPPRRPAANVHTNFVRKLRGANRHLVEAALGHAVAFRHLESLIREQELTDGLEERVGHCVGDEAAVSLSGPAAAEDEQFVELG
jgi:hypothetical protein